jgi:hypothetical protein
VQGRNYCITKIFFLTLGTNASKNARTFFPEQNKEIMVHTLQRPQVPAGKFSKLKAYLAIIAPVISLLSACGGAGDPAMKQAAEIEEVVRPANYAPDTASVINAEAANTAANVDSAQANPSGSRESAVAAAPNGTTGATATLPATATSPAGTVATSPTDLPPADVATTATPGAVDAQSSIAPNALPSNSGGAVILVPAQADGAGAAAPSVGSSETSTTSAGQSESPMQ